MKYTKIVFNENYNEVDWYTVSSLSGYKKNKLYKSNSWIMFIDSDKLEAGKEKFKKDYFKHLDDLKQKVENTL